MFQRKKLINSPFSKDKVIAWLAKLARGMKDHSQSVFMLEELQPSWLNTRRQYIAYSATAMLIITLICGLLFMPCLALYHGLKSGSNVGLLFILSFSLFLGLLLGVIPGLGYDSLKTICAVESLRWQWKQFWITAIKWLFIGLFVGLIIGLIILLVSWLNGWPTLPSGQPSWHRNLWEKGWFFYFLSMGMIGGVPMAGVFGFRGGMTHRVKVDKTSPNQGIKLSLKNAGISILVSFLITMLIIGLMELLIFGLILASREMLISDLLFMPIVGLLFGMAAGLRRGGSAVVKHYSLRFILWIKGYTPFNFIKFLDHCAKLILLKKVGGGYMFIHRMLLEHFAKMELKSTKSKTPK